MCKIVIIYFFILQPDINGEVDPVVLAALDPSMQVLIQVCDSNSLFSKLTKEA